MKKKKTKTKTIDSVVPMQDGIKWRGVQIVADKHAKDRIEFYISTQGDRDVILSIAGGVVFVTPLIKSKSGGRLYEKINIHNGIDVDQEILIFEEKMESIRRGVP